VVGSAFDRSLVPGRTLCRDYADRVIRKTPFTFLYLQRFRVPFVVVEKRLIRRKSPIPVDEELFASKESMLAELRGCENGHWRF